MPLSDPEQFQALLTVYHRVNERAIHYHSIMWQTAQVFSSGFTVLSTGSFFFFTYPQPEWRVWSVLLGGGAMFVALWGKHVLAQERTLFAYELQVRRRIEAALGWRLKNPTITPLPAFPTLTRLLRTTLGLTPFADVVSFEASYDPARVTYDPKKYNDLRFEAGDVAEVAKAAKLRSGVYGVFGRIFSAAWIIAFVLEGTYLWRLAIPAFGPHAQQAIATTGRATVTSTTSVAARPTTTVCSTTTTTIRGTTGRSGVAPKRTPAPKRGQGQGAAAPTGRNEPSPSQRQ